MLETQKSLICYSDGSFNKRSSGICCVVVDSINKWGKPKIINTYFREIEAKSSLELEYLGVIFALESTIACPIFTDNQQVYLELNNLQELKESTPLNLYYKAKELLNKRPHSIHWIKRDRNIAGIVLERRLKKLHKKNNHSRREIEDIDNRCKLKGYVRLAPKVNLSYG